MERTPVKKSDHVHSFGYDADKQELHVAFKNKEGKVTAEGHYTNVPPEKAAELVKINAAEGSVGSYLHKHIKTAHSNGTPLHAWVPKPKAN
jgi:hypothetical protein